MSWLSACINTNLPDEFEDYLLSRGVGRSLIEEHSFGWWDQKTAPTDPLVLGRYSRILREFIGRLLVPMFSPQGKMIGAEARIISGDGVKSLRLLTTPALWNPIFVGLTPTAMDRIWGGCDVWLVEGVFDATTLQSIVGDAVVLGTMRAAVTRKHLDFLKRFVTGDVYVAYDNDKTGQDSMHGYVDENNRKRLGVVEKINGLGLRCVPVYYRGGKDPNEIWERGGSPALQKAFSRYLI